MPKERDRVGETLREVNAAREDQWARQRDAELLERMRERLNAMVCPYCKSSLSAEVRGNVNILKCPHEHGAWLDKDSLDAIFAGQESAGGGL